MFKFIFRIITLTVFAIVLIAGLALWRGGEPFRWIGKKTEAVGKAIVEFGNVIDELKGKKEKVEKTYKELKEIIKTDKEVVKERVAEEKDGGADKSRGSK